MTGPPSTVTLEHYVRTAFGGFGRDGFTKAYELACDNVHEPIQRALGSVGQVEVLTDENTGDTACTYSVQGPAGASAEVQISSLLPYATVTVSRRPGDVRFLTAPEGAWTDAVLEILARHSVLPLSYETCIATSPGWLAVSGEVSSYYELLFYDEVGSPADWRPDDDGAGPADA